MTKEEAEKRQAANVNLPLAEYRRRRDRLLRQTDDVKRRKTQGCSDVTAIKEIQIKGTVETRLLQRKYQGYIDKIGIFDVFCGDGKNIIEGQTILGSPVEIIRAIRKSGVSKHQTVSFYASDNRQTALDTLSNLIDRYCDNTFRVEIQKETADAQLRKVERFLSESKNTHAIVVVDPNGPGVLPFNELLNLSRFSKQLDIIINISEVAINRIKGCSITKNKNWWARYDTFEDILWAIKAPYCEGWIRDAVKGDKQKWRIFTAWSWSPPKNPWEKQRLFKIKTKEDIRNILNGGGNGTGNTPIGPLFAAYAG